MGILVVAHLGFSASLSAECIKGNCFNGYGTYVFANGAKYIGDFKDGRANGKGIIYFPNGNKYLGDWQDDVREGQGRFVFAAGHEYTGGFHQNEFHGKGVLVYANGDRYEGDFRHDQPNGQGIYAFHDGDRYEGAFVNGRFEGEGTMYYRDGSRFTGFWSNSKKHGAGVFYAANGRSFSGEWSMGEMVEQEADLTNTPAPATTTSTKQTLRNCNLEYCADGTGAFTYSDGSRYEGEFHNGLPAGHGTVFYANGNRYEGEWHNDVPHGVGTLYYADGRTIRAHWYYGKATRPLENTTRIYEENVVDIERNDAVKIWAVVVGIAQYQSMPSLRFTDDDAYRVYSFLKSPAGGALPENQIRLLLDEQATRENILKAMRNTLHRADQNDVVVFYFSGHGLEDSFIPYDFDGFNNRLFHSEVKKLMEDSHAKHKLVIGDACHSGGLSGGANGDFLAAKSPVYTTLKKYYEAFENTDGGLALLLSSKEEEVSLEAGNLRSGIFSYYLIEGLRGPADTDGDYIITIDEIYNYVFRRVQAYTAHGQTPALKGNFDHRMPVGVVRH